MEKTDRELTWFLAQVKPNAYRIAQRNLQRQDFQTFLPLHEETRRKAGCFITTPKPLFPGYIFVAFDTSKGGWRAINSTYGVSRLVSFAATPQPVPPDLLGRLMRRCDADGVLRPSSEIGPGDRVAFSRGPFAGFIANVEKIDPDRRVWVLMELMGQETRICVLPETLRVV